VAASAVADAGASFGETRLRVVKNSRAGLQRLLSSIDSLSDEVDLVVVDAGSGLNGLDAAVLVCGAQCVVLVTTADDVSVMDAYAVMKASSADGIRPLIRLLVNREINGAAAEDAQRRVQNACRKFLVAVDRCIAGAAAT